MKIIALLYYFLEWGTLFRVSHFDINLTLVTSPTINSSEGIWLGFTPSHLA
ncbi:hypothetical protein KFK09_019937 [Dendrobium nobile]|uniref:Uncharacterized protein n=1 Tax=Dendrobium nobile TaxID=94219 RepID=A0A8T3ASF0_DENNO|nr:hypothetical protein KFK09_019937 [Dendrobium nobile]